MALVMALGMIAALTLSTLVSYTSSNARNASYSGASEKAYAAGNVVIEQPDVHDILTGIIDAGLSIL